MVTICLLGTCEYLVVQKQRIGGSSNFRCAYSLAELLGTLDKSIYWLFSLVNCDPSLMAWWTRRCASCSGAHRGATGKRNVHRIISDQHCTVLVLTNFYYYSYRFKSGKICQMKEVSFFYLCNYISNDVVKFVKTTTVRQSLVSPTWLVMEHKTVLYYYVYWHD